ncbi:hypothetical protein BJX61DRAFT_338028 [Aspergillus egyptiacus]|nr:hypothetical protein BJX61DRAFT_338028 [Aspergillus egyptiacus]
MLWKDGLQRCLDERLAEHKRVAEIAKCKGIIRMKSNNMGVGWLTEQLLRLCYGPATNCREVKSTEGEPTYSSIVPGFELLPSRVYPKRHDPPWPVHAPWSEKRESLPPSKGVRFPITGTINSRAGEYRRPISKSANHRHPSILTARVFLFVFFNQRAKPKPNSEPGCQ